MEEVFDNLLTEQAHPASEGFDTLPTTGILGVINREDQTVAAAVGREIPNIARAVDSTVERLSRGGRLFYIGAGTSGRLGVLDASECAPTYRVSPEMVQGIIAGGERALAHSSEVSEDDPEAGAADLRSHGFAAGDVLVGIAASGRTPYVLGAVEAARKLGALTVGISCNPGSELARRVDVAITPVTGPEVVAGSTRMKAGTATKLVLNMISTAVMIKLGHVYGNLMVNVEPSNTKLAARARRIIRLATGADETEAARLLEDAARNTKVAIVMARAGVGQVEAERLLAEAGGRISEALPR